ncbi:MAG TPA: metalloregulator ArsR/SmtB family transcription factor [Fimbriimonadaceae bacterium]|nr:metalloregulator ArsR/SmtB family transcription factor [Fimbriimonadaceae bacterium]
MSAMRESVQVFAALGEPTRLALVMRLRAEGPCSISRLTDRVPISRQAVTRHLRVLSGAGLVRETRSGRESIWEVGPARLDAAIRCLEEIAAGWDSALSGLKQRLESRSEASPLESWAL